MVAAGPLGLPLIPFSNQAINFSITYLSKAKSTFLNYAESSTNYRNIIPGNWTWQNKNSNSDYRNDSKSDIRKLRALFKNKKTLLSAEQLSQTIYKEIAKEISTKVNNYSTKDE